MLLLKEIIELQSLNQLHRQPRTAEVLAVFDSNSLRVDPHPKRLDGLIFILKERQLPVVALATQRALLSLGRF